MNISHLDHLVLTVESIARSCDFYHDIMGMEVVDFGNGRKALTFGNQKINLHQKGKEIDPKANLPTTGSADLCFISNTPVEEIVGFLKDKSVEIIHGPAERTGATGKILSIYFRDPDQNLIEVSNYLDRAV